MSSGGALNIAQELAAIRAEQAKKFAAYKAAQATEVEEDDDVIIVGDTRVEQKGVKAQGKRPAEGSLKEGKKAKVEHNTTTAAASTQAKCIKPRIFLTRTPGRVEGPMKRNTITLGELIDKRALKTALIYSFYIGDDELFEYLPLEGFSGYRSNVPCYIGRDIQMVSPQQGVKITDEHKNALKASLAADFKLKYGVNFEAFFPDRGSRSGCAHSKFGALIYEGFMRLFITSANMMNIDTMYGDNHWFVVDLPQLPEKRKKHDARPEFEDELLEHFMALNVPKQFINSIHGRYDYSAVSHIKLICSEPGAYSGDRAYDKGALRLMSAIKPWLGKETTPVIESCSASIGGLPHDWIRGMYHALSGGRHEIAGGAGIPPIRIYFVSRQDVDAARAMARAGAPEMGSHMKWATASAEMKKMFYHYKSKDQAPDITQPRMTPQGIELPPDKPGKGCMFHQKLILGFPAGTKPSSNTPPLYVYFGSANFSKNAWGQVKQDKRTNSVRNSDIGNWELGVAIAGKDIVAMLEPGSTWQDMVPFERDARPFSGSDKPFNSAVWAGGAQPDDGFLGGIMMGA